MGEILSYPSIGMAMARLAVRARAVAEGFAARSGEAEDEAEQTQVEKLRPLEIWFDMCFFMGFCEYLLNVYSSIQYKLVQYIYKCSVFVYSIYIIHI